MLYHIYTLCDLLLYLGDADLLLHVLLSVKSIFAVLLVLNACAIVTSIKSYES